MKKLLIIYCFTFYIIFASPDAKAESGSLNSYIRCFTDVSYIPEEDEYVGTIIIIMLNQDRVSVVFQEASGVFLEPVVVDGKWDKDYLTFETPDSVSEPATHPNLWKAKYKNNNLLLISPAGDESIMRSICD